MLKRWHSRVVLSSAIAVGAALGVPALFASGQQEPFRQYTRALWTQAQGLPQDSVRAIKQTLDGYLWLATDEGLSRFDGYDFVTFSVEAGSLPSNAVTALESSRDGSLWIGTPEGLTRYQEGHFRTFTMKDGLPSNSVRSLLEDRKGNLWIVAGMFVSLFDHGKFTTFPMSSLSPVRAARLVYRDRDGTIWVAGIDGVIRLEGDRFIPVLGPESMAGNIVQTIIRDKNSNLWIGGSRDLIKVEANGRLQRFPAIGQRRNQVRALLEDKDGNIWAGSEGGLNRLESGQVVAWNLSGNIQMDSLRSLFQDREGNLWVGMYSGLNRFRDAGFAIYGVAEGLPGSTPATIYLAPRGQVWIGYNGEGLITSDGKQIRRYSTRDGLPSNDINSIRATRDGALLVSTAEGLSRLHDGRFSNLMIRDSLVRSVDDALEDRFGRTWVATPAGLFEISGKQTRKIVDVDPAYRDFSGVLAEGLDGTVWFAVSGKGLWQISNGNVQRITSADGLSNNWIRALYQDPDGALWIGTRGGGLNELRDGTFNHYDARAGLLADTIAHIVDDGRGSLWLQTSRGVCRVPKRQLRDFAAKRVAALTPTNYIIQDRLRIASPTTDLPRVMTLRPDDSRTWFSTSRGAAAIDPGIPSNPVTPVAPAVQIVEMAVDTRRIDLRRGARLDPGPRRVQIRYTAIHLAAPEQVRYEYKMEGIDSDWVRAGTRRELNYTNLPHGDFTFRVRAWISGQAPTEASLHIGVLPYFYERWYFILICALSIVLALYGTYLIRMKQLKHAFSLALEERIKLAREIHDTLAQGFIGISAQLKAAAIDLDSHDSVIRRHISIARNMSRHSLTEARRSMRELREPPHENLPSALAAAVRHWKDSSSTAVGLSIEGDYRKLSNEIEKNVLRVAQEAVANAVKHSGARNIGVQLEFGENTLLLTVTDDGQGFMPSGTFSLAEGHFGLVGMRERTESLGGEFHIVSELGKGTQVTAKIFLPAETQKTRSKTIHGRLPGWARTLWSGVR
jgi:signal transduction histidine kinase/ligand-binding sensor domain-containing protein